MRDTYYVGFDPLSGRWSASSPAPAFDKKAWVFKVCARSDKQALLLAKDQYQKMMEPLSAEQLRLAHHLLMKLKRSPLCGEHLMMMDVPQHFIPAARELAKQGLLPAMHTDELMINIASAGWKALTAHLRNQDAPADLAQAC